MLNILFITIDTLRYDYVGYSRDYKKSKTPILDEISRESFVYDYAFSSGTSTPFAFPGILASVYSSQSKKPGVIGVRLTFAEYLKQKDYLTLGFNGGNAFVSNLYGYNRGIDYLRQFFDIKDNNSTLKKQFKSILKKLHLYSAAKKVLKIQEEIMRLKKIVLNESVIYRAQDQIEDLIRIIRENKSKRFFAFVNLMEVHGPYLGLWKETLRNRFKIDEYFRKRMFGSNERNWLELARYSYIRGLEIADQQIGNLLNLLDEMGLLKNTIVVITSDHGEEFLEHGNYDHLPKPYDELIRVPLIIMIGNEKLSPSERESERKKLVSLVDLVPSVTRYLFGEKPKEFIGKDTILSGYETREYIYSEGFRQVSSIRHDPTKKGPLNWCIRTRNMKYMELDRDRYLFDLRSDPKEQNPLRISNENEIPPEIKECIREFKRELLHYKIRNKLRT